MGHVKSFRELNVYKSARDLANEIFEESKKFPKGEVYSLTDQIRRSSRSVGAQVAEAWAKRRYKKHFISKLTDADGEQQETQHWIEVCIDCGYIPMEKGGELLGQCSSIGRRLNSMIEKADLFCKHE